MPTIQELQNRFTKDSHPANEKNICEVPFEDVMDDLVRLFGEKGWSHTVTHVGQSGNENFVITKLVLTFDNSTLVVPGAAQGPIGVPGLINMALKNAYLRHAGAGTDLYQHEPGQEPQFEHSQPQPQIQAPPGMPQSPFPNAGQAPKQWPKKQYGGGYKQQPAEWTGMDAIKTGPYATVKWKDVPLAGLQEMLARNPANSRALQELQRRGVAV